MSSVRTLTRHQKDTILDRDFGICMYCQDTLADVVDHIKPWSWDHDNDPKNLVASCRRCNSVASDMVFESFAAKKAYILKRRMRDTKTFLQAICPYCKEPFKPGITGTNICCTECAEG